MADADGKMRIQKCGCKKKNADNKKVVRRKKTRNADKTNKQLRKEIFLSSNVAVTWLDPSLTYRT